MTTCTTCSQELKPDARFCGKCGAPVVQAVAGDPAATAVVPAVVAPAVDLPTPDLPSAALPSSAPVRIGPPSKRLLIYVGAGILAVALVVTLGVVVGTALRGGSPSAPVVAEEQQGGTDEAEQEPAVAETTPTPAASEPAPPQQAATFQSASGNIRCQIYPTDVICQQGEIKYSKPSAACSGGPAGVVIGLNAKGVTWPCIAADVPAAASLAYDQPIEAYGFQCSINYDRGITCTNPDGRGFTMEYTAGIKTF